MQIRGEAERYLFIEAPIETDNSKFGVEGEKKSGSQREKRTLLFGFYGEKCVLI